MALNRTNLFAAAPMFLIVAVLLCGLVSLPQWIQVGPVSGLGALTVGFCGLAWALWLIHPYFPREHLALFMPMVLFMIYVCGSVLWYVPTFSGAQNIAVAFGFMGFILLTARECERDPGLVRRLHLALDLATLFGTGFYALTIVVYGPGNDQIMMARAFALFALIGVSLQLARWQAGHITGLVYACMIVAVVFLSTSRLAMAATLMLFPLAALCRANFKSILMTLILSVIGLSVLLAVIFLNDTMYERFFGFDASMSVGGVNINASGRTSVWISLIEVMPRHLWLGAGCGAASAFVEIVHEGLGHPHNDFLRYLFDFGVVGISGFLMFMLMLFLGLIRRTVPAARANDPDMHTHLAPLLALIAVFASMVTDNSISYSFVMFPYAVLIGCSLSRVRTNALREAVEKDESRSTPRELGQLIREVRRRRRRAVVLAAGSGE